MTTMMLAIDETASVEALAFDYCRFGLYVMINNFWTLAAVATAAVSFWRFKLAPSLLRQHVEITSPEMESESSPSISGPEVINLNGSPPPLTAECSDDGAVAGKRVYSRYDDVIDEEEELVEEERSRLVLQGIKTVRFDVLNRMRLLDLGAYEHQDMSVLDGNVVKLWDSCRVSLSPRAPLTRPIVRAAVFGRRKCSTSQSYIHL